VILLLWGARADGIFKRTISLPSTHLLADSGFVRRDGAGSSGCCGVTLRQHEGQKMGAVLLSEYSWETQIYFYSSAVQVRKPQRPLLDLQCLVEVFRCR